MDKISLNYRLNNAGNITQFGNVRQSVFGGRTNSINQTQTADVFIRGNTATVPDFQSTQSLTLEGLCSPMQLLKLYSNDKNITKLLNSSPKAQRMLKEKGIKSASYASNVTSIANGHLRETTMYAMQIADVIGLSDDEKEVLEKACTFHDFGKSLIPPEILNKKSKLTDEEKSIIDMHSELGYELLSKTNFDKRALNLIKNHHKNTDENSDVLGQILSVSDVYSALREERCYRESLSHEEAMQIINQKADNGELSKEIADVIDFIGQVQA